mmetsp:Transcript_35628/g.93503  ORF Transcript_35628/g.93503 Transcript_35628/m.93503 type:complete len:248 (+) Transcript_35628:251-994(+)
MESLVWYHRRVVLGAAAQPNHGRGALHLDLQPLDNDSAPHNAWGVRQARCRASVPRLAICVGWATQQSAGLARLDAAGGLEPRAQRAAPLPARRGRRPRPRREEPWLRTRGESAARTQAGFRGRDGRHLEVGLLRAQHVQAAQDCRAAEAEGAAARGARPKCRSDYLQAGVQVEAARAWAFPTARVPHACLRPCAFRAFPPPPGAAAAAARRARPRRLLPGRHAPRSRRRTDKYPRIRDHCDKSRGV